MKSLEQLKTQAQIALRFPELIEIAREFSPTAAYERAKDLQYSEKEAKSCRFLSIIGRDHGSEAMDSVFSSHQETLLDRRLSEEIKVGVERLEVIGGGKLLVKLARGRTQPFVEYLQKTKAHFVDLELSLGEYTIQFKVSPCSFGDMIGVRFKMVGSQGVLKVKFSHEDEANDAQDFGTGHAKDTVQNLRGFLYDQIVDFFCSTGSWRHQSAPLMIRNEMERRGEKVAPFLCPYFNEVGHELHTIKRFGLRKEFQKVVDDLRIKVKNDGVGPRALVFLDMEIADAEGEIEASEKMLDDQVPLLEKLRQTSMWVSHTLVPGLAASKKFVFLLNTDCTGEDWVQFLRDKGYGGSVFITYFNIDSGRRIAETGQCHAFLLQQHGFREKDDLMFEMQEAMEKAQTALGKTNVPKLPKFKFHPGHCSDLEEAGFGEFLDLHFSLK